MQWIWFYQFSIIENPRIILGNFLQFPSHFPGVTYWKSLWILFFLSLSLSRLCSFLCGYLCLKMCLCRPRGWREGGKQRLRKKCNRSRNTIRRKHHKWSTYTDFENDWIFWRNERWLPCFLTGIFLECWFAGEKNRKKPSRRCLWSEKNHNCLSTFFLAPAIYFSQTLNSLKESFRLADVFGDRVSVIVHAFPSFPEAGLKSGNNPEENLTLGALGMHSHTVRGGSDRRREKLGDDEEFSMWKFGPFSRPSCAPKILPTPAKNVHKKLWDTDNFSPALSPQFSFNFSDTHTHAQTSFLGVFSPRATFFFPQPHRGRRKIRRVASTFNSNFPPRTPIFLLFLHSRHLLSTPRWFSGTKLSPKLQKKEWKN